MDGSVLGVWKRCPGVALCPDPSPKRSLCRASVNPDQQITTLLPFKSWSDSCQLFLASFFLKSFMRRTWASQY